MRKAAAHVRCHIRIRDPRTGPLPPARPGDSGTAACLRAGRKSARRPAPGVSPAAQPGGGHGGRFDPRITGARRGRGAFGGGRVRGARWRGGRSAAVAVHAAANAAGLVPLVIAHNLHSRAAAGL
jgi:hypothetical protein